MKLSWLHVNCSKSKTCFRRSCEVQSVLNDCISERGGCGVNPRGWNSGHCMLHAYLLLASLASSWHTVQLLRRRQHSMYEQRMYQSLANEVPHKRMEELNLLVETPSKFITSSLGMSTPTEVALCHRVSFSLLWRTEMKLDRATKKLNLIRRTHINGDARCSSMKSLWNFVVFRNVCWNYFWIHILNTIYYVKLEWELAF